MPFLVLLHLGTATALLVIYRDEWGAIIRGFFTAAVRGEMRTEPERLAMLLLVGTIPAATLGVFLESRIKALFTSPYEAAAFLIVNGVLMLGFEQLRRRTERRTAVAAASRDEQEAHFAQAERISFRANRWNAVGRKPSRGGPTAVFSSTIPASRSRRSASARSPIGPPQSWPTKTSFLRSSASINAPITPACASSVWNEAGTRSERPSPTSAGAPMWRLKNCWRPNKVGGTTDEMIPASIIFHGKPSISSRVLSSTAYWSSAALPCSPFKPVCCRQVANAAARRYVAVVVPERYDARWYQRLLGGHRSTLLKALLLLRGGPRVIVINTPWHIGDEAESDVAETGSVYGARRAG